MLAFGLWAQRRVKHADDYATARGGYGPIFLAFAFAATTASGATFLGGPGLAYVLGFSSIWGNFLYPMGVYLGVLICMRLVATAGNRFGNRSIPEYLGDRFQSNGLRVLISILSLVLFFYLAAQLVSGLVMFETMLGMDPAWALAITVLVLAVYVVLGGAHADILTDGVQGMLMLALAVVVIVIFVFGIGLDGGLGELARSLGDQDENLTKPLNPTNPLTHSPWSVVSILLAHIPLGMLPHLGNKVWALKSIDQQKTFVKVAFLCGVVLGMMGLGGLLTRAVLGDELLLSQSHNAALPLLFIELFPTWLAALIGVGILAAIMSTADGLVVSSSQVMANDLYRRTLAPMFHSHLSDEQIDKRVLAISRISTVGVLVICAALAWALQKVNIALIVFIGVGGMMAAFAGPLVLGALWRGVTRQGAYAGLLAGFGSFVIFHAQLLDPGWFGTSGIVFDVVSWIHGEGPNPFSCAAMGEITGVVVTFLVSKLTKPLPPDHLDALFATKAVDRSNTQES